MKYPESLLSEDELIIFDVHHHPVVLFGRGLLFTFFLFLWIGLLGSTALFRETWLLIVCAVLLFTLLVFFILRALTWTRVNLVLTNERLVYRSGVFTKHTSETPLSRISDVSTSRLILGRIFGYGELILELVTKEQIPFFYMAEPEKRSAQIMKQVNAGHNREDEEKRSELALTVAKEITKIQPTHEMPVIPPEREPLYSEIISQMERLGKLRNDGTITENEFLEAKESLLKRLKEEPPGES